MPDHAGLRFGIIGAARIAQSFARGAADVEGVSIGAVASRDAAKGAAFAAEFGIGRVHPSYDALLADPAIDAVYVPLPNAMHAEWVIRAAAAGKHILCEKPIAVTVADAEAMFAAARRHGVHLVEAYPYRAQPQTLKLQDLLAAGAIGTVQLVHATFGFTFTNAADIRLDPAQGGGALLDAGSYAASFVRLVAGACPLRAHASAHWAESGVDRTAVGTLEFASGLLAQLWCSFGTAYHRNALIAGTDGIIETTYLNHPPEGGPPVLHLRQGRTAATAREVIEVAGGNGFTAEIASFRDLLAKGPAHWTGSTAQESVDTVAILAALAASARSGAWVDVRSGTV